MNVILDGPRMPPARGGKPDALVVQLHGYGSNGADLISLAPYWAKALPGAAFVSPNAIESVPQAPGGYQWFPITQLNPDLMESGARAASGSLDRFIDRELERYGLDNSRPGARRLQPRRDDGALCRAPRKLQPAAILGYSGVLVGGRKLKDEVTKSARPSCSSTATRIRPSRSPAMFESGEALCAAGLSAQWHVSYGIPHSIGPDGLELGGAFLATYLKAQKILAAR
ncbi:MAG: hypothetical protein WDM79_06440 [Terricaulis sp.]